MAAKPFVVIPSEAGTPLPDDEESLFDIACEENATALALPPPKFHSPKS
jgi:hypothetical protein